MIAQSLNLKAEPDAASWSGAQDLNLLIAGVPVHVSGLSQEQSRLARGRFQHCELENENRFGEISTLQVSTAAAEQFEARPSGVFYYRLALQHDKDRVQISGLNFSAIMQRGTCHTQLSVSEDSESFLGSLENTLRVICAYRLLELNTLLLHSVAFTDEMRGYVCIGRSGAGKSTLASLAHARGLRVLSDELNALPLDNAKMQMRPLPFAGDFGRASTNTKSAPVNGLFGLEQEASTFISKPSNAEAVSRVIAACPYINVDPLLSDRLDALAEKLVRQYRFSLLHFAKTKDFWEALAHD